jgi:hypothetical protein
MFNLADVLPASLTSVDDSLTANAPELTKADVDAASQTHLYVQQVAKAIAQQKGLKIDDPGLYKSEAWYDALTGAITEWADWVEIAGGKDVKVNNSTHSGSINLSAIMGAVMSLYLGPEAEAMWSALSTLLGGAEDPQITDFMNFWWSHVSKSDTETGLSVGPNTIQSDGQISWAVVYYSMTQVIDDWRVMFISSTYEEFDVSAGGLTLVMDLDNYVNTAQKSVLKYLGDDIANKIHNAPVPKSKLLRPSLSADLSGGLSAKIVNAPRVRGS